MEIYVYIFNLCLIRIMELQSIVLM